MRRRQAGSRWREPEWRTAARQAVLGSAPSPPGPPFRPLAFCDCRGDSNEVNLKSPCANGSGEAQHGLYVLEASY